MLPNGGGWDISALENNLRQPDIYAVQREFLWEDWKMHAIVCCRTWLDNKRRWRLELLLPLVAENTRYGRRYGVWNHHLKYVFSGGGLSTILCGYEIIFAKDILIRTGHCEDCGSPEETVYHALVKCTYARSFWAAMKEYVEVKLPESHPNRWATGCGRHELLVGMGRRRPVKLVQACKWARGTAFDLVQAMKNVNQPGPSNKGWSLVPTMKNSIGEFSHIGVIGGVR